MSEAFAQRLQSEFVEREQETPPAEPAREWDAWRIYDAVKNASGKPPLTEDIDPLLTRAVLKSVKSTSRSGVAGSRQVKTEDRLARDFIVEVFGSEATAKKAIGKARKTLGVDDLLQLAEKYLSGWRPERL